MPQRDVRVALGSLETSLSDLFDDPSERRHRVGHASHIHLTPREFQNCAATAARQRWCRSKRKANPASAAKATTSVTVAGRVTLVRLRGFDEELGASRVRRQSPVLDAHLPRTDRRLELGDLPELRDDVPERPGRTVRPHEWNPEHGITVQPPAVNTNRRHGDLVDRMADERDAYVIPEVCTYAAETPAWSAAVARPI